MSKKTSFYFFTLMGISLSIFIISELFFIFVDPFKIRIEPENYLKHIAGKDQSYSLFLENKTVSYEKVSPIVTIKRNEFGFRGRNLPKSNEQFKIIAMGGSTTECIAMSEGDTWTY